MSINSQNLLYNVSTHTRTHQQTNEDSSQEDFRKLMQVSKNKDKDRRKNPSVKEEEKDPKISSGYAGANSPLTQEIEEAKESAACTRATLPSEIEAIFEKMASCMLVMSSSREVKTTLCLNHPRFASSIFFGTKITIREFSTAPKMFNVEIVSNPLATAMIDASKNDLLSAFQYGKFAFSIHRLDTQMETNDLPLVHRKEDSTGEQEEGGHS